MSVYSLKEQKGKNYQWQTGAPRVKAQGEEKKTEQESKAVSKPQNGKQMGCTLVYTQDIIQPGRRSDVLRISLPRLNVLETQMGKDVLFCRRCQEFFLGEGQANTESVTHPGVCPDDTYNISGRCQASPFQIPKMSMYASFSQSEAQFYLINKLVHFYF